MSAKRFESVFVMPFLLVFQANISFAVVADANIISQLRQMKADKLTELKAECEQLPSFIRRCRFAAIDPESNSSYFNKTNKSKNPHNGRRPTKITFKSKKDKIEKINELNTQLEKLKQSISAVEANDLNEIIPVFDSRFHIGKIGRFGQGILDNGIVKSVDCQYCRIISIYDDWNCLVNFKYKSAYVKFTYPHGFGYGRPEEFFETIWLRGFNTSGRVTGRSMTPKCPLIITGTQNYENVMGAKQTVFVFEPLVTDPNDL